MEENGKLYLLVGCQLVNVEVIQTLKNQHFSTIIILINSGKYHPQTHRAVVKSVNRNERLMYRQSISHKLLIN